MYIINQKVNLFILNEEMEMLYLSRDLMSDIVKY